MRRRKPMRPQCSIKQRPESADLGHLENLIKAPDDLSHETERIEIQAYHVYDSTFQTCPITELIQRCWPVLTGELKISWNMSS